MLGCKLAKQRSNIAYRVNPGNASLKHPGLKYQSHENTGLPTTFACAEFLQFDQGGIYEGRSQQQKTLANCFSKAFLYPSSTNSCLNTLM